MNWQSLGFLLFLFWPLIGMLVIAAVNRARQNKGRRPLPEPQAGEVLIYMYLWPVVLYKYRNY